MIPPLLLLLMPVPLLCSQCVTSSDCISPHAPHCSKWGWCQWTGLYGEEGPAQGEGLAPGTCMTSDDCTPRAPVCSPQGYCTQRSNIQTVRPRSNRQPVIEYIERSNVEPVVEYNERSNIPPVVQRSNIPPVIQRSNIQPVIQRSNIPPDIPSKVPAAGTVHLSIAEAKSQAQNLRLNSYSEGQNLRSHGYIQGHNLRPRGYIQGQDQRPEAFIQDEAYFPDKGDQGLGGPSHGGLRGFEYNIPREIEREEIRRASHQHKSGNREINVFLKSQEGHRGLGTGAQDKYRGKKEAQQMQRGDQLAQESIAFEQKIQPSIGGSRSNINRNMGETKDTRTRSENNYSNHLPLTNIPKTDIKNRFEPGITPSLRLPSQFTPVPAVPTFGQKSVTDNSDYPDYRDYDRNNRNDQYDMSNQQYYYDDYYYDYFSGTEDILKKNYDYSLDSGKFLSQNDYPDDIARSSTRRKFISKYEQNVNQKSTNQFPFITENNTEKQKPPYTDTSKSHLVPDKIVENPGPGVSQGCLYDCVYECVAIEILTAYRDCVKFCGDACM